MVPTICCEKRNLFSKMLHEVFELQFNFTRQSKNHNITKRKYLTTFCTRQFHENKFNVFNFSTKSSKNFFQKFIILTYICCHMSWSRTLACDFTEFFSNFTRKNTLPWKPISYESALTFHIFQLLRIWESHFYENIFWHLSMSEDITKLRSCYINT